MRDLFYAGVEAHVTTQSMTKKRPEAVKRQGVSELVAVCDAQCCTMAATVLRFTEATTSRYLAEGFCLMLSATIGPP